MYKLLPILLFTYGFAVTTEDIYDNSYALIIGIDKYENVQHLNYAVKDAESIQDILVNTFDFLPHNVVFLKNEEATKHNILEAMSYISLSVGENDRVLIYYAGHGVTMDLPDGGEMGYLMPVDGNMDNLYLSSIGMDELRKISLISEAKNMLFLVGACYGGIAAIGSRDLISSKGGKNYLSKISKKKSRQIITAGGRGEQVIEKDEWGHSAFALNLNRGLKDGNADMNADGYITANELGIFLKEKVTIDSGNQQTPQYGRMTSQEGEFVFVYSGITAVIKDKSITSWPLDEESSMGEVHLYNEISTSHNRDDIYDTQWALIIGINEYQNENDLGYAAEDAEAIRKILLNHYGYLEKNITLLKNEEATLQNIKTHLGEIASQTKQNDAFLIFFAGHGITQPTQEGGEMGYLLPVDGDKGNVYTTCLPMTELKTIGSISRAKHVLFLMDACYGGLMALEYRSLGKNTPGNLEKLAREKSRQIITAGGKGEKVIEKAIWGHSAFTRNLMSALRDNLADDGDGFITANELAVYLKKRVTIDSEYRQTPQIKRYGSDEGEFIFAVSKKRPQKTTNKFKARPQSAGARTLDEDKRSYYERKKESSVKTFIKKLMSKFRRPADTTYYNNLTEDELINMLKIPLPHEDIIKIAAELEKRLKSKLPPDIIPLNNDKIYNNSWAVIIGINEYKSEPLKYAVNDALEIQKMLIDKFGFNNDNIRLLIDNEATYFSIREALYEIGELAKNNDRILVYFAGHGTQITTKSGMNIGYLIPSEGNLDKPLLGGIPMDDIFRMCQFSSSKHLLFLMDACYSGLMAESSRGIDISQDKKGYISTVANLPAWQIITAGNGEQKVLEGDEWQHSAFTYNLLKALNDWEADGYKDGYITATELGEYLKKTVADVTQGRQTPQSERIKASKGGEFIFSRNH